MLLSAPVLAVLTAEEFVPRHPDESGKDGYEAGFRGKRPRRQRDRAEDRAGERLRFGRKNDGGMSGRNDRDGRMGKGVMKRVFEEKPELVEELAELRKTDPEAAREKIHKIMQEYREKKQAECAEMRELVLKARDGGEEARLAIKKRLREQLASRLEAEKKQLEEMEKRLEKARERYRKRSGNTEKMIEDRVKKFTADPDLGW